LGPILFIIYINDLDNGLLSKILKFADDTKAVKKVGKDNELIELKEDLSALLLWSQIWQMPFNTDKCSVMHLENNNQNASYELGGEVLNRTKEEGDLGVVVSCYR